METKQLSPDRTFEQAVDVMVEFWVDKSFKAVLNQNNGDDSPMGGMTFGLMNMLSMNIQKETTPEQIEGFKKSLKESLMSNQEKGRWGTQCDVDYHPNELLANAAEKNGINSRVFPCKTFTYINTDQPGFPVEGRYQYGGEFFKI